MSIEQYPAGVFTLRSDGTIVACGKSDALLGNFWKDIMSYIDVDGLRARLDAFARGTESAIYRIPFTRASSRETTMVTLVRKPGGQHINMLIFRRSEERA